MQANWSLILNVILLCVVVVAIRRLVKAQRPNIQSKTKTSTPPSVETTSCDDIIAVRKIDMFNSLTDTTSEIDENIEVIGEDAPTLEPTLTITPQNEKTNTITFTTLKETTNSPTPKTIMLFLVAKENRYLAGYELLQSLLTAGLRFGEGDIFHRHHHANGQGPVLCSLAAATKTGTFDLQNIGGFSSKGLCLFMHTSNNPAIDAERFNIMLDTANTLSEELDALIFDDKHKPLTQDGISRYRMQLNIPADLVA